MARRVPAARAMAHHAKLTSLVAVLVAAAATATFPACGGQTVETVGSGGSTGTTTSEASPFACTGSQPELVLGKPTGYEQCANGMVHRPSVLTCPSGLPRTTTCSQGSSDKCGSDSDCTDGPHDFCGRQLLPPVTNYCGCSHGCLSDAECSPGSICMCGDPAGTCVPATCKSDADCTPGLVCAEYHTGAPDCGGTSGFACQTPEDTCAVDGTCQSGGGTCTYDGTKRTCLQTVCTI